MTIETKYRQLYYLDILINQVKKMWEKELNDVTEINCDIQDLRKEILEADDKEEIKNKTEIIKIKRNRKRDSVVNEKALKNILSQLNNMI